MSDELKREIDAITCESCAKGSHRDDMMNHYNLDGDTGERYNFRRCESKADQLPSCGTVCCIGGTAQILLYPTSRVKGWSQRVMGNLAKAMGLTFEEAHGLFFNWTDNDDFRGVNECEWPKNFRDAFADRKTARGKANVAVCLLRKIADEGGKCLHIQRDTES